MTNKLIVFFNKLVVFFNEFKAALNEVDKLEQAMQDVEYSKASSSLHLLHHALTAFGCDKKNIEYVIRTICSIDKTKVYRVDDFIKHYHTTTVGAVVE